MNVSDFANRDRLSNSVCVLSVTLFSAPQVCITLCRKFTDNNLKIAQKSKDGSGEKELFFVLVLLGNLWAHRAECRAPSG